MAADQSQRNATVPPDLAAALAASRAADAGVPDGDRSGSVHLTASTHGSWRLSSQPRSAGLPP